MTVKIRCWLLLSLSFALVLGCGKGSSENPAQLSGKVTYNNAPVTGGTLTFHGNGKLYPCSISPDGTYSQAALPTGELVVTVDTESLKNLKKPEEYKGASGPPGLKGKFGGGSYQGKPPQSSPPPEGVAAPKSDPGTYMKIPPKYKDVRTTDLKVTLSAGSQTHNFELKD